jgi:hypothetical protein
MFLTHQIHYSLFQGTTASVMGLSAATKNAGIMNTESGSLDVATDTVAASQVS